MRISKGCGLMTLIGFVVVAGCNNAPPPAEVVGTVTYDGQPVTTGIISFLPPDGNGQSSGGAINNGKYQVYPKAALAPGKYRVEIRWAKKTGEKNPNAGYGQSPDVVVEGLPAKYNAESVLTADLKSGMNTLDFNLEADPKPAGVPFGKLSAPVPADWKAETPANRLRSHEYRLPSGEKGVADAEVTVMPQSDPHPDKYFPQWKASFVPPEGKSIDDAAKVSKFEVNGATVHLLDVSGTWKYRDFPMAKKEELRPDYRVVWAIVVTGDAASHVRLSGPRAVVEKRYPEFEKWLKDMK